MAVISYGVVRNRYNQLSAQAKANPPREPVKRAQYDPKYSYLRSTAAEYKKGEAGEQYQGKGRAMTASEKKFYAYNKTQAEKKAAVSGTKKERKLKKMAAAAEKTRRDNMSDNEIRTEARNTMREKLRSATTRIRKEGVGIYTARAATAEDLDKKGKLPTRSLQWKADTYAKFRG